MDFLSGFKTYIVAFLMVLVGVARILGFDLPITGWEDMSGITLVLEGLAIAGLRLGVSKAGSGS